MDKLIIAGVIVLVVIVIGLVYRGTAAVKEDGEQSVLPDGFTLTAHTGCVDTKDNSLEAIEKGASCGADIVEFDLYFDKNGTPVLSHDKPKGGEVTLDEAFKKVSELESLRANVDVKKTDNLKSVVELAEKHGISDRMFFTGVFLKDVEVVKRDAPGVTYYLNIDVAKPSKQTPEYLDSLVEKVKSSGAVGINMSKKNITKKLVDAFHENGLEVSVWTVNKKSEMYSVLLLGPDNITTRRPDMLKEIIN